MTSGMTMKAMTSDTTEAPKPKNVKATELTGGASRGRGRKNKYGGARMKVRVTASRG